MIGRKALVVRAIAGSCERTVCRFYSNITDFLTGGVWAGGGVCGGGVWNNLYSSIRGMWRRCRYSVFQLPLIMEVFKRHSTV